MKTPEVFRALSIFGRHSVLLEDSGGVLGIKRCSQIVGVAPLGTQHSS